MKKKKVMLNREITVGDARTTPMELIRETAINFTWGFLGNAITLFVARELDVAVFINFILYYMVLSFIINRAAYETRLGKLVILPGSAAIGAFAGYKFAQLISTYI
jgi:hypothetical protein